MNELKCQLVVIGGGPGGYVCAIRAGQLGIDTVIVERDKPGGTCLNVGCIPSKALIHVAEEFEKLNTYTQASSLGLSASTPAINLQQSMVWKNGIVNRLNNGVTALLNKAGVTQLTGHARFLDGKTVLVDAGGEETRIQAEHVVIATGSEPVELPSLPFGDNVLSSTDALALAEVPSSLAVVGAGYIGLELGIAYRKLGADVTVVEATDRILPQYDTTLVEPVLQRLKALDVPVLTNTKAIAFSSADHTLQVESSDGSDRSFTASKVLVAVGRKPVSEGWGREELVLDMDGPFVKIDSHCMTNMRGVYAIGDVTGEPMLAHRAMAQGEMVAEIIGGHKREWDKACIPAVCFTDPEIVSAGLTEQQAKAQSIDVVTGQFPFFANGRAMTTEREDGFIRVIARQDNHLVLGIEAVGAGVSELSAAMGLAIEMGTRLEDIAGTIHAHPTRSEGLAEAAMLAMGSALHL